MLLMNPSVDPHDGHQWAICRTIAPSKHASIDLHSAIVLQMVSHVETLSQTMEPKGQCSMALFLSDESYRKLCVCMYVCVVCIHCSMLEDLGMT